LIAVSDYFNSDMQIGVCIGPYGRHCHNLNFVMAFKGLVSIRSKIVIDKCFLNKYVVYKLGCKVLYEVENEIT
jgi:hypothetical protein